MTYYCLVATISTYTVGDEHINFSCKVSDIFIECSVIRNVFFEQKMDLHFFMRGPMIV